jgi:ABC-type transport system involved in multi-copper enzyme maturation permease subunit
MLALLVALRWDWFKLARRWIPWILLTVLLLLSQLNLLAGFVGYQDLRRAGDPLVTVPGPDRSSVSIHCSDLLAGRTDVLPEGTPPDVATALQAQCQDQQTEAQHELVRQYQSITLPGSIIDALNIGLSVTLVLLAILAASHLGAEYAWGTVRPNLIRGIGRWRYLAAKLIVLALVGVGALLAIVAITALASLVVRHFAPPPPSVQTASWNHAAVVLGKASLSLIPFLLFTSFFTLLVRSSGAGMAIAIGYYLGEHVVVQTVGNLTSRTQAVARYLIGQNIDAWAGVSFLGLGHTKVGSVHALVVLAAYAFVLACAAFCLFAWRDVGGASAG